MLLLIPVALVRSQINGYGKVTAITNNSVLTLSNVNQTYGSFTAGSKAILIQMQGASIGSNTTNASSFGNLSSLNSAGLYEVVTLSTVTSSATAITLSAAINNTYDVNGGLQLVTFPMLGTGTYVLTSSLTGVPWDGNVGGVIAFYVGGKLDMKASINADGIGFRGGAASGPDGGTCDATRWRNSGGSALYAYKGEGIYITNSFQASAKGKAVNGGGGGNVHNGGGGGGGNYSAGGDGYYGWPGAGCGSSQSAAGVGGIAISSSASRVFLGGGGGGGQENDGQATAGARGGGVILIKADSIITTSCTGGVSISTNGNAALDSGQDGAGGGGAGGTIVINTYGFRLQATCPLTIAANGGNGANVVHWDTHGSGGGGGQGAVYIYSSITNTNLTVSTDFGLGGLSSDGGGAPRAGSGGGPANSGVFSGAFSNPLPIVLKNISAYEDDPGVVRVLWETASEKNNKQFDLYRSHNGAEWNKVGTVAGAGTSRDPRNYSLNDYEPGKGLVYYRLKQTDFDGTYKYSDIVYVSIESRKLEVKVYPNPGNSIVHIESSDDISSESIQVFDSFGKRQNVRTEKVSSTHFVLDFSELEEGLYFINSQNITQKVIISR